MDQTYETRRRSGKKNGSLEPKKPEHRTGILEVQSLAPETESRKESKMKTAKALGFKKGDFVHTGAFPGIIMGDVHTAAPTCEVWGFEHEMGSAYSEDLTFLTWEDFQQVAKRYGFDGTAYSKAAKEAIAQALAKTATEVPVTA